MVMDVNLTSLQWLYGTAGHAIFLPAKAACREDYYINLAYFLFFFFLPCVCVCFCARLAGRCFVELQC